MNPRLSLAIGIICIAFSPIFVKLANVAPVSSSFYRLFVGWLLLTPYCIVTGKLKIDKRSLIITLTGGVIFALDIFIWNISLQTIPATTSTLLGNLTPIWVGFLTLLFFKRNPGKMFWIGTTVAVAGMVVLVGYENIIKLHFSNGILLAALSSVFYAFFILATKNVLKTISTQTFMFYSMLASCLFLLLIAVLQQNNVMNFSIKAWLCFLGMGVICQLIGWLAINRALHFLEPTKVSLALLSVTAVAGCFAAIFLDEKLAFSEILGSIIVLGGIAITFLRRNQTNKIVT
jgi:drug/metabolite transporter (DMT)-like permease